MPNRLLRYNDLVLGEQIPVIPQAQAEAVVESNGVADDLARKSMAEVEEFRVVHGLILPRRLAT